MVIDPTTHQLLAVASSRGDGSPENLAFGAGTEPGSVIKILTALDAERSSLELSKVFPLDCKGFIVLDGRQFFDWAKHGDVGNLDQAMAVSCNVAFARIGLALGKDRLQQMIQDARFNDTADLGLFQVPLGTTRGPVTNDYELANYAIGLDHYHVNALHLAMIADMMANRGVMTTPTLYTSREGILGTTVGTPPKPESKRLASPEAAQAVIEAMKNVIDDPRGTGHRARIDGLEYAFKTGTAGTRPYEALIVGFAPADHPKLAFALQAWDVGPAEIAGARIIRDFLTRIPERLH